MNDQILERKQNRYKLARGRLSEKKAKALSFDRTMAYSSYFFGSDADAILADAPVDIPMEVALHVVLLFYTFPIYLHEFPGSDIALIKARLLAKYDYVAALPRFAYLMGILEDEEILTPDEAEDCCFIMLDEMIAANLEGQKV